jgi:uncharacterized RDD family membrane protein YckC
MEYAPLWKRAAALIIDGMILSALTALCLRTVILFPLAFILHFFYRPIFESSSVRATPGKYLASISVVKSNGDRLSLRDAYVRYFSSWLSGILLGLGYLFALFTKKHQTLHDLFADTVVVNEVYESNGLWNAWLDQMKFLFSRKTLNK